MLIIRNSITALAAFFIFQNIYAAEDWQTVVTVSDNLVFAIDHGRVERKGDLVTFWEKLVYIRPDTKDETSGKWIKEKKVKRIMHCKEKTQGYIEGITYGDKDIFITAISLTEPQVKMNPIPPNTVAEKEFDIVCPAS